VNNPFDMRLAEQGADRSKIVEINKRIRDLQEKVDIKAEEGGDKFSLLKKIEIKLHALKEQRVMFEFWDRKFKKLSMAERKDFPDMKAAEKEIVEATTKKQQMMKREEQEKLEQAERDAQNKRIAQRLEQGKMIGRLPKGRSEKPKKVNNKRKEKEVPDEVKDMRTFLGFVTEEYPDFMQENPVQFLPTK